MSTMYKVKNRSAGVAGYVIPEIGVRRSFAPGEVKVISVEELEKLTYVPGGLAILTHYLQILDEEAISHIGIKTQPEYYMSEKDIVNLIKTGSTDEFLDCLDYAPSGVIELLKTLSVQVPLVDIAKRAALKSKTGFDVEAALKNDFADKEVENNANEVPTRKAQEPASQGRRTAAPNYKVVTTLAEKKEE